MSLTVYRIFIFFKKHFQIYLTICLRFFIVFAIVEVFKRRTDHISFQQTYADEGHDLNGVLEHVYRSMENFLTPCLSLDSDEMSHDETTHIPTD